MAGLLDPRQGDGTWVENRPTKWQQTWDILGPYVTGPAYAVKGLMDTPLEVLLGAPGTEAAQDEAVANSFNAAGAVMAGGSVVPKPTNAMNMGIRAYHGSPHDFDKFDFTKMGTGEGAQEYGKGGYFAENEGTARGYRDRLKPERAKGSMYEVDINADPEHFINYDVPLTEQSSYVRDALRKHYGFTYDSKEQQALTGGDVVNISAMTPEHAKELNKHGIAGVRYLDGASHKDGVEQTSNNYVVFDDNLINILRKYGIAGLLGTGAAGNAMFEEPQEVQ